MSEVDRKTKKVVRANDIVEELTREADELIYTLRDAQVSGKLDLKHCIVNVAVYLQNCEFVDEVDFRYCEFKQAVDLSGCFFRQDFKSGDQFESHTVYRKDLICNEVVFEGVASFNGSRFESNVFFWRAEFQNEEAAVDLGSIFSKKA